MLILRFRETFRERCSEWVLASITLALGYALLSQPGMFSRPYFALLNDLAPQVTWGVICTATGMVRLGALILNGGFRPSPALRQIGAGASMMIWLALDIGSLSFPGGSIGWTYLTGLFVLDAFALSFAAADGARYAKSYANRSTGALASGG